jgi:hypothetical protein
MPTVSSLGESVIQIGDHVVNLDSKTVEVGGQRVNFIGIEYRMLELLSLRKGMTITKEMFLNHLYGGMDEPEIKIIDGFICKLRRNSPACRMVRTTSRPSGVAVRAARAKRSRGNEGIGTYKECPLLYSSQKRESPSFIIDRPCNFLG